jgi:hypothetical protein
MAVLLDRAERAGLMDIRAPTGVDHLFGMAARDDEWALVFIARGGWRRKARRLLRRDAQRQEAPFGIRGVTGTVVGRSLRDNVRQALRRANRGAGP